MLFIAILTAFACTFVLTPAARRLALSLGLTDAPDASRKLHTALTPRLGGVAIGAGIAAGTAVLLLGGGESGPDRGLWILFAGAAAMLGLGLYDDIRGLGFKKKFVFQSAVAYALLHAGWRIDVGGLPGFGLLDAYGQTLVSVPVTMLWVVGIMNAINLIDGQDGLAAGVCAIASASMAFVFGFTGQYDLAAVSLVLTGALVAFFVYNTHPASIFMGDSGSLLLGFFLAALPLKGFGTSGSIQMLLVPAVALGLPLLDTIAAMWRRLAAGRSPFAADADHVHHRTVAAFRSVRLGVAVLHGVAALFGTLAVLVAVGTELQATLGLAATAGLAYVVLRQLGYVRLRRILRSAQGRLLRQRGKQLAATKTRSGERVAA